MQGQHGSSQGPSHEPGPRSAAAHPAQPEVADLSPRQAMVLRAVVGAFLGEAGPIGSPTLVRLLPEPLSPASIRNTLAELTRMGLVDQAHASSGRVPTHAGLRLFVDQLLDPQRLEDIERREIAGSFETAAGAAVMREASRALSERTHQLGFVLPPRLDRIVLSHLSLVRLGSDRVLVVLISRTGVTHQHAVRDDGWGDQAELDRVAGILNERIHGRTLSDVRGQLAAEARTLRRRVERLAERAVWIGVQALAEDVDGEDDGDLVVVTRLALLDQVELRDTSLLRELLEAVETREQLVHLLDGVLDARGVRVSFGWESEQPGLERCAIVAAPYGRSDEPLGLLGVLGPHRMNYGRIIPLVEYLSRLVTEKLAA